MRGKYLFLSIILSITTAIGLLALVFTFSVAPSQTAAPFINFSNDHYDIGEADGTGIITVTLDSHVSYTVTVDYGSSDQTAVAGIDYVQASGTLTFSPGSTSETFTIDVIDNAVDTYPNVQAGLYITNPGGALLGLTHTARINIIDDELSFVFLPLKLYRHPLPPVPTD